MFQDDTQQPAIGWKILLSSYIGSPHWYNVQFKDAMVICRVYHKPDYFITMTSNPNCPEIKAGFMVGQKAQDHLDLVARVFKLKKDQFLHNLITGQILGQVVAHMHVLEFKKWGLLHAHILIILADENRTLTNERVDSLVVAELPPDP